MLFFVFLYMTRCGLLLLFLLWVSKAISQEVSLPVDLRQHNVGPYNASLFHPGFSLTATNEQSVALWSRWQWQNIDADPTTLFLNYSRKLKPNAAASIGFFQHNTGLYVNTGGVLNYAYAYEFNSKVRFGAGLNLFGFQQAFADERFVIDPLLQLPISDNGSDFILQIAPGIFLQWSDLTIGLTSENLLDYNFSTRKRNSGPSDRIYTASVSYDLSFGSSATTMLRPLFYYKSVPGFENQFGIGAQFSTEKYWTQLGYNDFYGFAFGAGGRFFKKLSLGGVVETGTSSALRNTGTTFELVAMYQFGGRSVRKPSVTDKTETVAQEKIVHNKEKPENAEIEKTSEKAITKTTEIQSVDGDKETKSSVSEIEVERPDTIPKESDGRVFDAKQQQEKEALQQRSIEKERRKKRAMEAQKRLDSIQRIIENTPPVSTDETVAPPPRSYAEKGETEAPKPDTKKETVVQQGNEKYEEVLSEGELLPGFYLITNVFGTKTYYTAFMKKLKGAGLAPKSFVRSSNRYNYVYLKRFDTMSEAREARDSRFYGKYQDKTWIFRVVGR